MDIILIYMKREDGSVKNNIIILELEALIYVEKNQRDRSLFSSGLNLKTLLIVVMIWS